MYTFISLKKCTNRRRGCEPLSTVEDSKSTRSDCNSAGVFLWRQAQDSGWEKNNPALKVAQQLSYRKTTHLGKKILKATQ